jgi:2',3'-cyclic-nucleotide 2'-phosphodiesterase (5'-nucleotidase family)
MWSGERPMARAVIFHTGDLHNRLSPAAARQLQALKRDCPGSLLVDAGDAVAAGNLTFSVGGEPILRLMTEIGYDAMAMGNRESHPRRWMLERKLRDVGFPVLAANVSAKEGSLPPFVRSHKVFDTEAGRVAIVGIAPQMVAPESVWARVADYVFTDPVVTVGRLARALRREAELVVCLSHCGRAVDAQIAALPEVDLVLGGHSHLCLVEQEPGRAMIVHAGHHGSHVARTEIAARDDASSALEPLQCGP